GNAGTNVPLIVGGKLFMDEKDPRLDLSVALKNLNLRVLEPFVSSFMTGLHGLASGDVTIKGRPDKPELSGKLNLNRTEFRITYLNVPYSLSAPVEIERNGFRFNNVTIYDSLLNKAKVNGMIMHDHFTNLALDLNVDFDDFSAFRNTYQQNQIFYGNARAGGIVTVKGPVDDLLITAKVRSTGGTHVVIPISLTAGVEQNDFIIFENKYKDTLVKPQDGHFINKGLGINLSMLINPDANIEVFLPDQMGNIKGNGTGNLTMTMLPGKGFSMLGSYTISKGSFVFAFKNLMRLPFSIREGSRIEWAGDPTDANVSITGVYKTRVPLEGLTSDAALAAKRVPVECIIRIGGKLMNPDLAFGINVPNAEEAVKSAVYSAIDTNNQVELSQQVLSVLVINQFKNVVGSSTMTVNAAPLNIVTNQLSSMLSQITHNVNVGVNYKAGTNTTGQEFDVAVSTQLLNDRLLIDGTFGMSNDKPSGSSQQASQIVGDINIEYVLTDNRRWRLRAFNRTNTNDNLLNNNAPYTQGVGVSWQRDFTRLSDLFKLKVKK
ncbi:MAG: translocation/assembly module TamB domain-containing protein, partial [Bacteroidota bacterium]